MFRGRMGEDAELRLWEIAGWFLFHSLTIMLAFWAGVSFGKRVDDESRREIIRAIEAHPLGEKSAPIGASGEAGSAEEEKA